MVYIMIGTGFEELETVAPCDVMRRAGLQVQLVGLNGKTISGSNGIVLQADILPEDMDLSAMDLIMLPGGLRGVASIQASEPALNAVRYAYENGKLVAAICAAPTILAKLGITDGRNATCYPGMESQMGAAKMQDVTGIVRDGNVITGTSAGCAIDFGLALVRALLDESAAKNVAAAIVYRR